MKIRAPSDCSLFWSTAAHGRGVSDDLAGVARLRQLRNGGYRLIRPEATGSRLGLSGR
jgi:hypothetical protein